MKRVLRIVGGVVAMAGVILFGLSCGMDKGEVTGNRLAPDISLPTLDGQKAELAQLKGKVVLVNFWATWCGWCAKEIPDLVDLHARYEREGLAVLGVALDRQGASVVKPFVEKKAVNYPILLDPEDRAWAAFALGRRAGIPTTIAIDRRGRIRQVLVGYQERKTLESAVKALLAERSAE
jgi:peroxiredoxin